jgi:hypothetical protein
MALAIITSISAVAATQTSPDDPGKQAIEICGRAWKSAYGQRGPGQSKNSRRKSAKNNEIKKMALFARYSPFNSFRISKSLSGNSKMCTKSREF